MNMAKPFSVGPGQTDKWQKARNTETEKFHIQTQQLHSIKQMLMADLQMMGNFFVGLGEALHLDFVLIKKYC